MSESIHKSERKPQTAHTCCICLRDITGKRRVKDPKGRYFCKRCYKVGQLRKYRLAKRKLAATPNFSSSNLHLTLAGATLDTLDNLPVTVQTSATIAPSAPFTTPAPTPAPSPTAGAPSPAPAPIPAATVPPPAPTTLPPSPCCPLCNEPLPPNQRVCNDCAKELPKLNNLLTVREEHTSKTTRRARRLKTLRTVALAAVPIALASVALIAFGRWFTPHTPFDQFPTTRAQAVEEMLSDIQDGSDSAYDNALHLLSSHSTANPATDDAYKSAFKLMHEDFLHRYGSNWLGQAQIENILPDLDIQLIPFSVTIHNDVYHVTSQALASATPSTSIPHAPSLHFPENGKQHFAIAQIEEYAVLPDATIQRRDPLKLRDAADIKSEANTFPPSTPPVSQ